MRHRRPPHPLDRQLDELAAAVARDLQAAGKGPPELERDELGRWRVRDAEGVLVATVGVRTAPHRPGLSVAAWGPDGSTWTPWGAAA